MSNPLKSTIYLRFYLVFRLGKRWVFFLFLWSTSYLSAQPVDIKFDRFEHWENTPKTAIDTINQDADGFLWLTMPTGNTRFDGNTFESFPKSALPPFKNKPISTVWIDANGNQWQGDTALHFFTKDGKTVRTFPLPEKVGSCRALFLHPAVTGDSVLWLLTDFALLCFDLKKQQFNRIFCNRPHDVQSLYGAPFRCAFFSQEGILWLGGETGFCKYDWRNQEFRLYGLNAGEMSNGGEVNQVLGVKGNPSRCWVTTSDFGLLQYDLQEHRILPEKITVELKRLTQRNTYGLGYDKLGRLWVGNTSDSIFVCDLKQNKIVRRIPLNGDLLHFADTDFKRGHFCYILQEADKMAMIRITPETMRIDTFWIPYWQEKAGDISTWLHDKRGTAWLLHNNKYVECFNPQPYHLKQKPLSNFAGIEKAGYNPKSLRNDAERNTLWLATADELVKINWEKETATVYQNSNKSAENKHKRIEIDALGRVWIQCVPENVIYKFDPARETFARYDWSDGLPETVAEVIEFNRVEDKWCQRYHNHTFSLFNPLKIMVVPANPPLITSVQVAGKKISHQSGAIIQIPSQIMKAEHSLRIAFTSVAFEQGKNLQFRYQLSGVDTGWVTASADRIAYYNHLPAGDYRFQVMVANREGDWQPTPAVAAFTIVPPLYTQTLFQVTCSFLFLGLFYMGFRIWEKRRKVRYQLRQRIAEDLHEQVGLALDSISRLSASNPLNTPALDFLDRIEQQTLMASEKLSDLVWLINPENDTFDKFITHINNYAHSRLLPLGITPIIFVEKEVKKMAIPIEKRKDLYLHFKAALSAFVLDHTFSQVKIRITKANRQLKIEMQVHDCQEHFLFVQKKPDTRRVTILSTP